MLVWLCEDNGFKMSTGDHTQCGTSGHQVLQVVRSEHRGAPSGQAGWGMDRILQYQELGLQLGLQFTHGQGLYAHHLHQCVLPRVTDNHSGENNSWNLHFSVTSVAALRPALTLVLKPVTEGRMLWTNAQGPHGPEQRQGKKQVVRVTPN